MFARVSFTLLVAAIFGFLSVQAAAANASKHVREARWLKSADNTTVYAIAAGNPNKKPMIFIHGFACNAAVFDALFNNEDLLAKHYLVSQHIPCISIRHLPWTDCIRYTRTWP